MHVWNPWHGCNKISTGCENCYVYRTDAKYGKDSSGITKLKSFNLPIRLNRYKQYKIPAGETLWTCFTSDFLLEEADIWRSEAWSMIRERKDINFVFLTKRIHRLNNVLPNDWGEGYDNVTIGCTCENQNRADFRLPIFLSLPIKRRLIVCEPLLEHIELTPYLSNKIDEVIVGGESGYYARVCDFAWIKSIYKQCELAGIDFTFRQTGARFKKDGKLFHVPRKFQLSQAAKANLSTRFSNKT